MLLSVIQPKGIEMAERLSAVDPGVESVIVGFMPCTRADAGDGRPVPVPVGARHVVELLKTPKLPLENEGISRLMQYHADEIWDGQYAPSKNQLTRLVTIVERAPARRICPSVPCPCAESASHPQAEEVGI